MRAYILLDIRTGEIPQALNLLKRVDCVQEANMTFGPYDAVAVVECESLNDLGRVISRQIQPIPGIIDTLTCLAVEY